MQLLVLETTGRVGNALQSFSRPLKSPRSTAKSEADYSRSALVNQMSVTCVRYNAFGGKPWIAVAKAEWILNGLCVVRTKLRLL